MSSYGSGSTGSSEAYNDCVDTFRDLLNESARIRHIRDPVGSNYLSPYYRRLNAGDFERLLEQNDDGDTDESTERATRDRPSNEQSRRDRPGNERRRRERSGNERRRRERSGTDQSRRDRPSRVRESQPVGGLGGTNRNPSADMFTGDAFGNDRTAFYEFHGRAFLELEERRRAREQRRRDRVGEYEFLNWEERLNPMETPNPFGDPHVYPRRQSAHGEWSDSRIPREQDYFMSGALGSPPAERGRQRTRVEGPDNQVPEEQDNLGSSRGESSRQRPGGERTRQGAREEGGEQRARRGATRQRARGAGLDNRVSEEQDNRTSGALPSQSPRIRVFYARETVRQEPCRMHNPVPRDDDPRDDEQRPPRRRLRPNRNAGASSREGGTRLERYSRRASDFIFGRRDNSDEYFRNPRRHERN